MLVKPHMLTKNWLTQTKSTNFHTRKQTESDSVNMTKPANWLLKLFMVLKIQSVSGKAAQLRLRGAAGARVCASRDRPSCLLYLPRDCNLLVMFEKIVIGICRTAPLRRQGARALYGPCSVGAQEPLVKCSPHTQGASFCL